MDRTIIGRKKVELDIPSASGDDSRKEDPYLTKLLKYIPVEVVATSVSLNALCRAGGPEKTDELLLWLAFGLCAIATPFYLRRVARVRRAGQIIISTIAYPIWVMSTGGVLADIKFVVDHPVFPAFLMVAYTFVVPIFQLEEE